MACVDKRGSFDGGVWRNSPGWLVRCIPAPQLVAVWLAQPGVKLKPRVSIQPLRNTTGGDDDEHGSAQHYRHQTAWRWHRLPSSSR